MIEIRWHGRGGQGAKSASQLLAMAQLRAGRQVQAFPEYGPERTGAPMRAYNRVDTRPIRRHDGIATPDAVVVLDPALVLEGAVSDGLRPDGLLLANWSGADAEARLRRETGFGGRVVALDAAALAHEAGTRYANVVMVGALAGLLGEPSAADLDAAAVELFGRLGAAALEASRRAIALGLHAVEGRATPWSA
jgi:pyruvate ferredoxin oxidoreductase gamma subunit